MKKLVLTIAMIGIFASFGYSQKKPVRKTPVTKTPVVVVPPLDVRAAREKTDVQLSNVNAFVDKLGTIAPVLETALADQAAGKLKPETSQKVDQNKAAVIYSIRNLKTGLSLLEAEFKTKTVLAKYLPAIQGVTDLATQSEDSALAGKFAAAKDPLRAAAQKLTDTLAVLPK